MEFPNESVSPLYAVSPKSAGTSMCESLTSYIIRLSREHNIMLGTLINKIMAPMIDNNYILNGSIYGGNRFYDGAKSLNGFDKNASEFTRILDLLTSRNDIKKTTNLEIKGLVSSRNLLRSKLAWCSICLKQWGEDAAYYPLIWFFKDVKVCLQHNCKLEEVCSSCGKTLPILHRKSMIGYCPYCNKWLGVSIARELRDKLEIFKAQEISTLVASRFFLTQKYSRKSIVAAFLRLINCHTNGNLSEFSRGINISKVTLWDWVYGGRLPSLGKILDICFTLKISLIGFLNVDFSIDPQLNLETKQKKEEHVLVRRKINKQELQERLEILLLKNPSVSLSEMAKIMEYDRKVLMANCPEICHLIVKQYKEYRIRKKDNRYFELIRSMDIVINQLYKNEVYPSRREVEKFLNKPALLHERRIREEWLKKILE
ncbi:TniQ family protein [Bacillus sp. EKM501B]|uniref:TniQ family protein n=1 Tax=Bacillus sp. EKM501B TaxID=1683636 RepID=UPI0017831F68|nr:TniQ family protein [Bacillus sp. EKM501B]KAF6700424.1 TniQ family protein [Bacillus sp. EKM501B]